MRRIRITLALGKTAINCVPAVVFKGPMAGIEKRVRFAPLPVVYNTVPWNTKTNDASPYVNSEEFLIESPLYPTESALKQSFGPLRTSMNTDKPSVIGYAVVVAAMMFIFFIVWWIAKRLLVLEIEEEVKSIRQGYAK